MSRTATPQTGKAPQASATHSSVPMEKVAMRAYEKWMQSGCKHGCDRQHWFEAEQEIRSEMMRTCGTAQKR